MSKITKNEIYENVGPGLLRCGGRARVIFNKEFTEWNVFYNGDRYFDESKYDYEEALCFDNRFQNLTKIYIKTEISNFIDKIKKSSLIIAAAKDAAKDNEKKCKLASKKNTPIESLLLLAKDKNDKVRLSLSNNPSTPSLILSILCLDDVKEIRDNAILNPNYQSVELDDFEF